MMQEGGDALIQSEQDTPKIRRQYAQSLIDQGNLTAALAVLTDLVVRTAHDPGEHAEARGLIGRVYKQLYVNAREATSERHRRHLERAVQAYLEVYHTNPRGYLWHGINVVALLLRARHEHIALNGYPNAEELARAILQVIEEKDADGKADTWDLATAAEACVALNHAEQAHTWITRYVRAPYADAFE
jgi:hypothetical protein